MPVTRRLLRPPARSDGETPDAGSRARRPTAHHPATSSSGASGQVGVSGHRPQRRSTQISETPSIGRLPVLAPIRSTGMSNLSMRVTRRSAIVGCPSYPRCRPHFHRPAPPPSMSTGRVPSRVDRAVRDAAPVEDRHVVEQGAVTVGHGIEFLKVGREQLRMVAVDPGHLLDELRVVVVVARGDGGRPAHRFADTGGHSAPCSA